jgi:hypothetical protein
MPDVVREGETGWLFEAGDVAALVERVRQAVACRTQLLHMGQAARAFAETRTWPAIMDEVVALYERLAPQRGRRW